MSIEVTGSSGSGRRCAFEPGDTVDRVAARLRGLRWRTPTNGLLEVVDVETVARQWPIRLRLTIANDDWTMSRMFEVAYARQDTLRGTTPTSNAEGLADEGLILIERHLQAGPVRRVTEITGRPPDGPAAARCPRQAPRPGAEMSGGCGEPPPS